MVKKRKIFLIGFLGNVFEWYDFAVYPYLASALSVVFFPASNVKTGVLRVFLLFFISYLARPFGSIFFGFLGDKRGRAYSLKLSLFLMGVPSFLIALLPTYKSAGFFAVILFALLRIIQGFAAGGELPGSACYVYELSDERNRNFFSSFVAASSMLGVLSGSLVAMILYFVFTFAQITQWAWRVPFLIGGLILVFLYKIRTLIQEDDEREDNSFNPLARLLKNEISSVLKIMMLYVFISVSFYLLFVWMPSYLTTYLHVSHERSLVVSTTGLAFLIFFTLVFGYIERFVGKKILAVFSVVSILTFSWPAFVLLNYHSTISMWFVVLFFAVSLGSIDGVIMAMMNDLFTKEVRCSGVSIAFTFSTAIFGGSTPLICSYLINHTGWTLSPVLLLVLACLIGLPAALLFDK